MRLEMGSFPVNDVVFGRTIRWQNGVLEIDRNELLSAVLSDRRIVKADLHIAKPGESVRITSVRDVIEPRIKVAGPGMPYPGVCGRPVTTVGQGRTYRLAGLTVVEVSDVSAGPALAGSRMLRRFIDMSGPGAVYCPYGSMLNLCLVAEADPALHIEDANEAVHAAALVVSDRLAATTVGLQPPEMEIYELTEADSSLPNVVYITCHNSPQHYANSLTAWGLAIYGLTRQTPPWLLHPNELLDGAISSRDSWILANNPVVKSLYKRHGVELNFVGCIAIRTRWSSQAEKDVTSLQVAKMAKMLGAQGAVITWDAGGNDFMEVIRTVQACEHVGVKTVFVTPEENPKSGGHALLEPLPEADAIVSTGLGGNMPYGEVELPAVERVIGREDIILDDVDSPFKALSAKGQLATLPWVDFYGYGRYSLFDY